MSQSISVLIAGHQGKMGAFAQKILSESSDFTLVPGASSTEMMLNHVKEYQPDVVLDLTHAKVINEHLGLFLKHNIRSVIGASGLTEANIQKAQETCEQQALGMFIVPNFSIGMMLMQHCAELIAPLMPHVEIIETHHQRKIDAPSGTALDTAKRIDQWVKPNKKSSGYHGFNTPIHSLRMPHAQANQDIIFSQPGESLTLSHHCLEQQAYASGIQLAIKHVMTLKRCQVGLSSCLIKNK